MGWVPARCLGNSACSRWHRTAQHSAPTAGTGSAAHTHLHQRALLSVLRHIQLAIGTGVAQHRLVAAQQHTDLGVRMCLLSWGSVSHGWSWRSVPVLPPHPVLTNPQQSHPVLSGTPTSCPDPAPHTCTRPPTKTIAQACAHKHFLPHLHHLVAVGVLIDGGDQAQGRLGGGGARAHPGPIVGRLRLLVLVGGEGHDIAQAEGHVAHLRRVGECM